MNYNMDINVHCIQFIFHLIQHKRTLSEKHMQCEIVLINKKNRLNEHKSKSLSSFFRKLLNVYSAITKFKH